MDLSQNVILDMGEPMRDLHKKGIKTKTLEDIIRIIDEDIKKRKSLDSNNFILFQIKQAAEKAIKKPSGPKNRGAH